MWKVITSKKIEMLFPIVISCTDQEHHQWNHQWNHQGMKWSGALISMRKIGINQNMKGNGRCVQNKKDSPRRKEKP